MMELVQYERVVPDFDSSGQTEKPRPVRGSLLNQHSQTDPVGSWRTWITSVGQMRRLDVAIRNFILPYCDLCQQYQVINFFSNGIFSGVMQVSACANKCRVHIVQLRSRPTT